MLVTIAFLFATFAFLLVTIGLAFVTFGFFLVIFGFLFVTSRFLLVAIGFPFATKRFTKVATRYLLLRTASCLSAQRQTALDMNIVLREARFWVQWWREHG
jgi:hypothetical protein